VVMVTVMVTVLGCIKVIRVGDSYGLGLDYD